MKRSVMITAAAIVGMATSVGAGIAISENRPEPLTREQMYVRDLKAKGIPVTEDDAAAAKAGETTCSVLDMDVPGWMVADKIAEAGELTVEQAMFVITLSKRYYCPNRRD